MSRPPSVRLRVRPEVLELEDRVLPSTSNLVAVGAEAGGGPRVRVTDAQTHQVVYDFFAFPTTFTGGVHVAVGDVNADGTNDIIVGAGLGALPEVKVYDGKDLHLLFDFLAFPVFFRGGVEVAAGDVLGDGEADIICAAGAGGGPQVNIYSSFDGSLATSFYAFPSFFTGGVHVAVGDVNADGVDEIITGAGAGGGPEVAVFDTSPLDAGPGQPQVDETFYAFEATFRGGVDVAAAYLDFDGNADIITGAGKGGGPRVRAFSGADNTVLDDFYAYAPSYSGGVHVAGVYGTESDQGDIAVTPESGQNTLPLRVIDGMTGRQVSSGTALDAGFAGGAEVADESDATPSTDVGSATDLGTLPDTSTSNFQKKTTAGALDNETTFAWYSFTVDQNSTATVALSNLSGGADAATVELFDTPGDGQNHQVTDDDRIAPNDGEDPGTSIQQVSLAAGTYYVRVALSDATTPTNFTLAVSVTRVGGDLLDGPDVAGFSKVYGYGRVDAGAAVGKVLGQTLAADTLDANEGRNFRDLNALNIGPVYKAGVNGSNVVVAVIDSGVAYRHPALRQSIWQNPTPNPPDAAAFADDKIGWNFVGQFNSPRKGANAPNDPNDTLGTPREVFGRTNPGSHGTHVAGIIGAVDLGNRSEGVAHAELMSVRVLGIPLDKRQAFRFPTANIGNAIRFAADNGAKVINLSLNFGDAAATFVSSAVQYAVGKGAVVVISAGNSRGFTAVSSNKSAFTGMPGVLVVGNLNTTGTSFIMNNGSTLANTRSGGLANQLNYVVAPGTRIYAPISFRGYGFKTGTSMATPYVAGVVALMIEARQEQKAKNPSLADLTPAQITQFVTQTANPNGIGSNVS